MRADARFHSEACEKRHKRRASTDKAPTHSLQEVREQQATKKHNRDLGGLIRQAIIDRIKTTGECFADDLTDLYPEGEVKECRRLATAQFGSMVATGLIREKERRKSTFGSRKGAKAGVYVFTEKGRQELSKLVGVGSDRRFVGTTPPTVTADPGESSAGGRGQAVVNGRPADATPDGDSPDPLQLDIPESPRLFDYDCPEAA
jgi:hypothetical protein